MKKESSGVGAILMKIKSSAGGAGRSHVHEKKSSGDGTVAALIFTTAPQLWLQQEL